jgi:RNA polymerase sigma-70 factor (ECF subfamily)
MPKPMSTPSIQRETTRAAERARVADELVAQAQCGDHRAFDALVRRFRPRIYALALHVCGSASDADDITQEAFVKAFHSLPTFEGRSAFFTWLYRITLHKALSVQRTKRVQHRAVQLDDARVEAALRVDGGSDPRATLELRETYALLVHALDQLPPSQKSAVILTTLSGLSCEEAAVVLGTSPGAISVRIHEARKRLRASLSRPEQVAVARLNAAAQKAAEPRERWTLPGLSLELAHALQSLL